MAPASPTSASSCTTCSSRAWTDASHIYGIETREELVQKSTELAARLGFPGMSFLNLSVAESTESSKLPATIDVVTALHACNTATDDAIDFALKKKAKHIVLVPCCQAEVAVRAAQEQGQGPGPQRADRDLAPPDPHARIRQPDHQRAALPAARGARLPGHVTELVGWEHSMKNELIVATYKNLPRRRPAERLQEVLAEAGPGRDGPAFLYRPAGRDHQPSEPMSDQHQTGSTCAATPSPSRRSDARRDGGGAEVGDDVYGDDPTVNRLQDFAAELFGFEAGMFAPTGTQTNLIALMTHCGRGDEYLVGQEAHTYKYEGGGAAVLGSIQPQPIANQPDGSIALADIEAYIKPDDMHFARTRLLALENTIGGRVLPQDYVGRHRSRMRKAWRPTSTARASATPPSSTASACARPSPVSTPCRSACRRAWARRSARCCWARRPSSSRASAGARCWAAACARPA
jgi:hypothetical protein